MTSTVNWVAIIAATVAAMGVGFLWYSPLLFAKRWMKLSGLSESDLKKSDMGKTYGVTALLALLAAFVMYRFMDLTGSTNLVGGVMVGLWAGVGFVLPTLVTTMLYENKPTELMMITFGHHLATFLVMGLVLGILG